MKGKEQKNTNGKVRELKEGFAVSDNDIEKINKAFEERRRKELEEERQKKLEEERKKREEERKKRKEEEERRRREGGREMC